MGFYDKDGTDLCSLTHDLVMVHVGSVFAVGRFYTGALVRESMVL